MFKFFCKIKFFALISNNSSLLTLYIFQGFVHKQLSTPAMVFVLSEFFNKIKRAI